MKISPTISSVRVSRMRFYFCFFQRFLCSLWRAWSSTISWEQRARLPRDSISAAAQRSTRLRGCCPRHSCSTLGQGTGTCSFPTASAGPPGAGLTPELSVALAVLPHWAPQGCGVLCALRLRISKAETSLLQLGIFHLYP